MKNAINAKQTLKITRELVLGEEKEASNITAPLLYISFVVLSSVRTFNCDFYCKSRAVVIIACNSFKNILYNVTGCK